MPKTSVDREATPEEVALIFLLEAIRAAAKREQNDVPIETDVEKLA